jgi:hypothetical protein
MEDTTNGAPTPEEVTQALGSEEELTQLFSTEEERKIAVRLLPLIAAKANALAEARKTAELSRIVEQIKVENTKTLESKIEEFRKALTPPTPEELNTLLNQEYLEFPMKVGANGTMREFVIRELPLATEIKVVKVIQKTLGARLQEIARIDWVTGMSNLERIEKLVTMVPGAMETIADCVALCLDPSGKEITGEWVQSNIGLQRLTGILHAQMAVSRYRDFLSLAGRLFPQMKIA